MNIRINKPEAHMAADMRPSLSERSERSHAFQKAWMAIPRTGVIPDKADFRPERFIPFLPDIYLSELCPKTLRVTIRLAGQNIREHLGTDIKGMDYSRFVPDEHKEESCRSMPKLFGTPPMRAMGEEGDCPP